MQSDRTSHGAEPSRRGFLGSVSTWFMAAGLLSGYGATALMGVRYLFPARRRRKRWQYLARADAVRPGDAIAYRAPTGERVTVARKTELGTVDDFVALSSTCPHLGCQVHWEAANDRFFCPCHNGVFDRDGLATAGPPAEAKQHLPRYPLEIRNGILFIEVPVESVSGQQA